MLVTITPLYASICALVFIFLSLRVILLRRSAQVGIGDGGHSPLARRMRVHGNFSEYVPLALLLMLMAELQQSADWLLHGLGLILLAGRFIHAYGVGREPEVLIYRVTGMSMTFAVLIIGALINIGAVAMRL